MSNAQDRFMEAHFGGAGVAHESVPVDDVVLRDDLQARADETLRKMGEEMRKMSERMRWDEDRGEVVDEYGRPFPPIELYETDDGILVVDGFTRTRATKFAGIDRIQARIRQGDYRDAFEASLAANDDETHGVRRTRADLVDNIKRALRKEWMWDRTDAYIAERCRTTNPTVAKYREEVARELRREIPSTRTDSNGHTITVQVDDPKPWVTEAETKVSEQERKRNRQQDDEPDPPGGKVIHQRSDGTTEIYSDRSEAPEQVDLEVEAGRTSTSQKEKLTTLCADITTYLPRVSDGSVDVVVSAGVDHIEWLNRWARVIKHGARAIGDSGVFLGLVSPVVLPKVFGLFEQSSLDYLWTVSVGWTEPEDYGRAQSSSSSLLIYGRNVEVSKITDRIDNVPRSFSGLREIGLVLANRFAQENWKVLNPMSGEGGLAAGFLDRGCHVTAIDYEQEKLNVLESNV